MSKTTGILYYGYKRLLLSYLKHIKNEYSLHQINYFVSHVGLLIYNDNKWKMFELDYYKNGKIIRNLTSDECKY